MTSVYFGQTVGWFKMPLGVEVGLGPSHIVLDGDPAPPHEKGHSPNFRFMSVVVKRLGWIRIPLVGTEVGHGPGDIVLDGDLAPPPMERGTAAPSLFRHMSTVAKRSPISAAAELLLHDDMILASEDQHKGCGISLACSG